MTTVLATLCFLFPILTHAQGFFFGNNPEAPTRIGSSDGPFAGSAIFGQFLAGTTTDSLIPVGNPLQHAQTGYIYGGDIAAPGVPPGTFGYLQMVALGSVTKWCAAGPTRQD